MKTKEIVNNEIKTILSEYIGDYNDHNTRGYIINKVVETIVKSDIYKDYLVVCDERNNPPSIIDQNKLALDLFTKTDKEKEFKVTHFLVSNTRNIVNCLEMGE